MADVKVDRDGNVTKGDTVIGRAEKRALGPGLYETVMGVSATSGGRSQWWAFAADGTQLSDIGYDTRKKCVERIEKHSRPLAVEDMKVETGLGTSAECITAGVSWQGNYCSVSRYYPIEDHWVVDMLIVAGAFFPTFANGTGTRHTQARVLRADQAAAADAEAVRLGLIPAGSTAGTPA